MEKITQDKREIESIFWPDSGSGVKVGMCGVTKIAAYNENGQMEFVPWFAVWHGNELTERYNGAMLEGISYKEASDATNTQDDG